MLYECNTLRYSAQLSVHIYMIKVPERYIQIPKPIMSIPTRLGQYLEQKSINKASVARRTGLGKNRLTTITTSEKARLTAEELYLIAIAIGANPCELLEYV